MTLLNIRTGPARTWTARGAAAAPIMSFRADLQGLRAVAIVVVVLAHVLGWPAGGVDVFFVISGFLITGLLLKEHRRAGRISFVAFYRRRVRRIVPAAVAALAATTATAWFLTPGTAFRQVALDAESGAFSFANWRFAATGTDYFAQTGATSPLQHFWWLSVEEQFYFVWPCLLLVLLGAAYSRRAGPGRAGPRPAVRLAFIGLLLASFVFACWQTAQLPTVACFSTFTRGWELGAGALLALAAGYVRALSARAGALLSWTGLVVIGVAIVIVRSDSAFPGPLALLPVLGAVMVMAGGTPVGAAPRPLTNRVAVGLGETPYS